MSTAVIGRFRRSAPPKKAKKAQRGSSRKKRVSTSLRLFRQLRRNRVLALAGALLLALTAGWQTGVFELARDRAVAFAGETAAGAGLVLGTIDIVGLDRTSEAQ